MEALKRNHFEFFSLPVSFAIDAATLEETFRRLQSTFHPDRFANASQSERRYAMQLATQANAAYLVLRDPLSRARYLCELNGWDVGAENNTAMPGDFLMQQMEWRESLDDIVQARDRPAFEQLCAQVSSQRAQLEAQLARVLDGTPDYLRATDTVRRLMFLDKFGDELTQFERRVKAG